MHYYHFVADTPFIGTENHYFLEVKKPLTEKEIAEECEEYKIDNAGSYSYLVTGWDENWDNEEEMEDYYADCSCYCEEITDPEEWEELQEEYA